MEELQTREIQVELLSILIEFDRIARIHNIRYSLDGGTLLGAVRHKGFIPWDDDVDVIVPRPDFERLASHPGWFSSQLYLEQKGNRNYIFPFMKLVNPQWIATEPSISGTFKEFLWLDIFPADGMPVNQHELATLMSAQRKTSLRAKRSYVNVDLSTNNYFKKVIKRILFPIHRRIFPASKEYEKLDSRAKERGFGSASIAGDVVWGPYKPDKPGFPIEDFDNLIDLDFEGHKFKACPHWDEYLTGLYGDYMQLPPEDQRVTHGMKVWKADSEKGK